MIFADFGGDWYAMPRLFLIIVRKEETKKKKKSRKRSFTGCKYCIYREVIWINKGYTISRIQSQRESANSNKKYA